MTAPGSALSSTSHLCYKRLLRAARGANTESTRLLRCFPLRLEHFKLESTAYTPREFHAALCQRIRSARSRVRLASLYIGPAADPGVCPQEAELLQALATTSCPDVQILLDQNRALRPVPVTSLSSSSGTSSSFITSAQACHDALQQKHVTKPTASRSNYNQIFLLPVLPDFWQSILPNPYNEVAGVFHMKAYIVDDDLILSGANLSEEYFCDRVDRYLWIQNGGNGLVDCYADLFHIFCQHANPYNAASVNQKENKENRVPSSSSSSPPHRLQWKSEGENRRQLMRSLSKVLTTEREDDDAGANSVDAHGGTDDIVAYAVPTLQAPAHFFTNNNDKHKSTTMPSDAEVVKNLIRTATTTPASWATRPSSVVVRLATAYLNPTAGLLSALQPQQPHDDDIATRTTRVLVHFLTAGRISHGFKPKAKAGNKGKEWIPTIFDTTARQAVEHLLSTRLKAPTATAGADCSLWFYQREHWSFHAKGIWLSCSSKNCSSSSNVDDDSNSDGGNQHGDDDDDDNEQHRYLLIQESSKEVDDASSLVAVTHGSSNYGERSAVRDLESNLILIFPDHHRDETKTTRQKKASPVQQAFGKEWNRLCEYARPAHEEEERKLQWHLSMALPWIRSFF